MTKEERAVYDKAYRENNREKIKAREKAYRENNREKIKARRKACYENNREKIKACQKAYHENNREKINARKKAYYENNREEIKASRKAYREDLKNDPNTRKEFALNSLLKKAKDRSKRKNLEYNLDYDWAVKNFPEFCPVFGIPLTFFTSSDSSASIDRLDNSKGYTKENCRFISVEANSKKNANSLSDITKIYNYMIRETQKSNS